MARQGDARERIRLQLGKADGVREIAASLRSLRSEREILRAGARGVARLFAPCSAAVAMAEDGGLRVRAAASEGTADLPIDETLLRRSWDETTTLLRAGADLVAAGAETPVSAKIVASPMEGLGACQVTTTQEEGFSADDVRLIVMLTEQVAQAVRCLRLGATGPEESGDLAALVEQLGIAAALIDENGRVTLLTRAAAPLLGVEPSDLRGKPWEAIWSGCESGDPVRLLRSMIAMPRDRRQKVVCALTRAGRSRSFVEAEVEDDPRTTHRRIILLRQAGELDYLRARLPEALGFHGMLGRSALMRDLYLRIGAVAATDATVLITGETGTGKELVARAIHDVSPRHHAPFVAVNCGGLTDSLLASQLFGHRRGAFTGAVQDHRGFFETAHGGTLFLDEVGDVSPAMQTSLLRALEEHAVMRVGDSTTRHVDVRVIAATHRDLQAAVEQHGFRADLLYRIQVARIRVPPLRERREDIPLIVDGVLAEIRERTGRRILDVADEVLRRLLAYPWPGNVRELRSAIEYAVIRAADSVIEVEHLPPEVAGAEPEDESARLLEAVRRAGGNKARAARSLGMSRATFYRRLKRLRIVSA